MGENEWHSLHGVGMSRNKFWEKHDSKQHESNEPPEMTWEEIYEADKKPCQGDWTDYEPFIDTEGSGAP